MMYDQMAAIYGRYKVTGCLVKYTVINRGTEDVRLIFYATNYATAPASFIEAT